MFTEIKWINNKKISVFVCTSCLLEWNDEEMKKIIDIENKKVKHVLNMFLVPSHYYCLHEQLKVQNEITKSYATIH
jgi:hypothetical protein